MTAWTITPWACACGHTHAPWWRTTPPPSCPNGWPATTTPAPAPDAAEHVMAMFARPLPWPPKEQ